MLMGEVKPSKGKKPKRMWKPSVIGVEKGIFGKRSKYESGLSVRAMPSTPAMKKMWSLVHGTTSGFALQRPGMSKKVALRANQYYKMSDLMYKPKNRTSLLPQGAKNYVNFLGTTNEMRKMRKHLGL
jgi:hypothetical protein